MISRILRPFPRIAACCLAAMLFLVAIVGFAPAEARPLHHRSNRPPAPVGVRASATHHGVAVSWRFSGRLRKTAFRVYRNGVVVGATRKTRYVDQAPATGIRFTYWVRSYDPSGGLSAASRRAVVVVANSASAPAAVSASTGAASTAPPSTAPASLVSAAQPTETSLTASPAISGHSLYWGAWIGSQLTGGEAPWDLSAVDRFEALAGKSMSLLNFSSPFYDCTQTPCQPFPFPTTPFNNLRARGIIPFFSWNSASLPVTTNEPNFTLSKVAGGAYDSYIRSWAQAAAAWAHPFFLRLNWEMNGNWFPWGASANGNTPAQYVAAWRHIHDIFVSVGATNATWVWCPNIDPAHQLVSLASVYPGDQYVDWTCLDGYNGADPWTTFSSLFSSTYTEVVTQIAPTKPMMIGEVGSTERGGAKGAWIADMLNVLPTEFPKVRGILWFDKNDAGPGGASDWPIESSPAATQAFAAGITNPTFVGSNYSNLSVSPIPPP